MSFATILRPGDVIGGFEVEDLIGVGGMATVYQAKQVSLGRPVALKVLSRQLSGDEVFRERFRREGMHAASLEHPNIVPVYDSGEQDGLLYLAMRLVEGPSLAELLSTEGISGERALAILLPVASALDCAHAAGLIHRDVKPQNILITHHGHPYLADFGVAKASGSPGLTATGGFVGSVNYASPEQIKGVALTAASDIYALTAVLYHCLSGDVPYPGESEAGVMHAHLSEPPPTLPALEGADSEFQEVFARGMAKDPEARYPHAGDLLEAAARCLSRMPTARRRSVPAFPRSTGGERTSGGSSPQPSPATGDQAGNGRAEPAALESLTAVDLRRQPPPPEAPSEPPPKRLRMPSLPRLRGLSAARPRMRPLAIAASAIAITGIAIAIASLGGGSVAARSVSRGSVELSYRAPWRLTAGASPFGLRFADPIALGGAGATLTAGMLADGAPVPGGLPPRLAPQLDQAPSRTAVRLGSVGGVRYTSTAEQGKRAVTMFVVSTDRGDIGLLCVEAPAPLADGSCTKTAETLRVIAARPVPRGPDPALAAGLRAALQRVAAARAKASDLMVGEAKPRAGTARRIAAADVGGARQLTQLSTEPRDRSAVAALAVALRGEAHGLEISAAAAQARDYRKYARAAASIESAGRTLSRASAALRRMGFGTVPALRSLDVTPLPRPRPKPQLAASSAPSTSVAPAPPVATSPEPAPAPAPPVTSAPHAIVSAPK